MKKGITLAILSIVILLMIILITTITTTGTMAINNSRKMKFASELALVQELADEYANNNEGEYPVSSSLEIDLSNVTSSSINQFNDEVKNVSKIILYQIDFSILGKTDLIYGNKAKGDLTDVYAVSKETGKVYYIKGLKIGKVTYYTLTDDLKDSIDYTPNSGSVTKDGIIFNTLKSKWTNKNVESIVKVPSNLGYTNVIVSTIKNNNVFSTIDILENTKGYDIYKIQDVSGNYQVKVEYTKDETNMFQIFDITNFDDKSPEIVIKSIKPMVNEKDNVKQTYIDIDFQNDLSGIKYAKYETDNISDADAKKYFTSNGNKILNGTIIVDKFIEYVTIYVEDNAGNYSSQVITLDAVVTDKDYVEEGLVLYYDGINNTGSGHSDSVDIWKDLSGNDNDGILVGFDGNEASGWTNNSLKLDGINDYVYKNIGIDQYNATVEVVYKYYEGNCVFSTDTNGSVVMDENMRFKNISITNFDISNAVSVCFLYNKESQNNIYMKIFENTKYKSGVSSDVVAGKYISLGTNLPGQSASQFAKADIFAVRIYNRALTQEEINKNYKIDKLRFGI